jgi:hypothetical protein
LDRPGKTAPRNQTIVPSRRFPGINNFCIPFTVITAGPNGEGDDLLGALDPVMEKNSGKGHGHDKD